MPEHYLHQELSNTALEPLQPTEKKLIGAVLFVGLVVLGALFFVHRYFPLAN